MILKFLQNSIRAQLSNKNEPLDKTLIIAFRVSPIDLDLNFHMNNGRYLSHMDTGKIDFLIRTGLAKKVIKQRAKPVTTSVKISFFKDLKLFERYRLITKLIGVDSKWLYFEQSFKNIDQKTVAHSLVKLGFSKDGLQPIKNFITEEQRKQFHIEKVKEHELLKKYEEYALQFR